MTICLTFGTKGLHKKFSIEEYEHKMLKLKEDVIDLQEKHLEAMKTKRKLELKAEKFESELKELLEQINSAKNNNDLKTANLSYKKYKSIEKRIEENKAGVSSAENNIALIEKSIDILSNQITAEEIKFEELKNKEQTSKAIASINTMVKDIKIGLKNDIDMKSLSDMIENEYIDSKVENEILLEKFSSMDTNQVEEFTSAEDVDTFLTKVKEINQE